MEGYTAKEYTIARPSPEEGEEGTLVPGYVVQYDPEKDALVDANGGDVIDLNAEEDEGARAQLLSVLEDERQKAASITKNKGGVVDKLWGALGLKK